MEKSVLEYIEKEFYYEITEIDNIENVWSNFSTDNI